MTRGWIIFAGGGLLLASSFASALLVAHELVKTGGSGIFGITPAPALIIGLMFLTLGIAGVGLGAELLNKQRSTAGPDSPAPITGREGDQDASMPAALVAQRLETLLALQAGSRAAGSLPVPQATVELHNGWRNRLTDPTAPRKPAQLVIPRIQRQPGNSSGDDPK